MEYLLHTNNRLIPHYFAVYILLGLIVLAGCKSQSSSRIQQKPVQFDSTRAELSLQYLKQHYGMSQKEPSINPQMIVVHWTAIPSFEKSFNVFDPPTLRNTRPDIKSAGALNVSAHYLIKRNGTIFQLLPDTLMARHVIGLNHTAIGIENVGSGSQRLTKAQLKANAWLVTHLTKEHNIQYLIGHYEYPLFEDHPLWKETDDGYRTEKTDPGKAFMKKLRNRVDSLGLRGAPVKEDAF